MAETLAVAREKEQVMMTEIRASEEATRSLIEHMPVGLFVATDTGVVEQVNAKTEELPGFSAGELVGKRLSKILVAEKSEQTTSIFSLLKEKAFGPVLEIQCRRQDGTHLPVEVSLNQFKSKQGDLILVNLLDVSERHRIEKMKQEFVAMVSHDLRTPLTSIQFVLDLVIEGAYGEISEKGCNQIERTRSEADRLIKMINDLLDMERMQGGKMSLEKSDCRLANVVRASLEAVVGAAAKKDVKLESADCDYDLHADADRLVQVLVNLLGNAVKFSPAGSSVKVFAEEADGFIKVSVQDFGRGVYRRRSKKRFSSASDRLKLPMPNKKVGPDWDCQFAKRSLRSMAGILDWIARKDMVVPSGLPCR